MKIQRERVYDFLKRKRRPDEYVVLVDRVWPRGVARAELDYDEWGKQLAPSGELRRWFAHDPDRWSGFRSRYLQELKYAGDEREQLRQRARQQTLTLLYSARDEDHNQAVVLQQWLEEGAD